MNSDKCLPIIKRSWLKQFKPICYGIIGPDGKLFMSESCICEDKQVLEDEECRNLNEETEGGYRVVRLYVKKRKGRR